MKKVILMLAVAAMASCSKSEVETRPVTAGDVEIVSGSSKVITRAPFDGSLDDKANNDLTAYVYATKLDVANSNAYVDYKAPNLAAEGYMKFISDSVQTSGKYPVAVVGFTKADGTPDPQYYPMDNNPMYMVGLIPSTISDWTMDSDAKNATYAIDGKTDIMVDAITTMKDNTSLLIQKNNASATVYPAFKFKHKLTLVNVKAYAETAKEQEAFGKIVKIEVIGVNGHIDGVDNVCSIKLEDGTATATGYAVGNTTPFYYCNKAAGASTITYSDLLVSSDDDKTADATVNYGPVEIPAPAAGAAKYTAADADYVAYAMIAPFTATATGSNPVNLKLQVYTEKNPNQTSNNALIAPISMLYESALSYDGAGNITNADHYYGSTEGKMFDVTLKFVGTEIKASATVKTWDNLYTDEVIVE